LTPLTLVRNNLWFLRAASNLLFLCVHVLCVDSVEAKHKHRHKVLQEYGESVVKEMRILSVQNHQRSRRDGVVKSSARVKYIVDKMVLNYRNIGESIQQRTCLFRHFLYSFEA